MQVTAGCPVGARWVPWDGEGLRADAGRMPAELQGRPVNYSGPPRLSVKRPQSDVLYR
jgi:hypothetical protein